MPVFGGVNAKHERIEGRNRMERRISGRFFPQGAGAIVNASNIGRGFSVARTGVGRYVVTLDGGYPQDVHADVQVRHATLVYRPRIIATTTDATGTITLTIQVYDTANPGVAVELAAAATTSVSFDLAFLATTQNGI